VRAARVCRRGRFALATGEWVATRHGADHVLEPHGWRVEPSDKGIYAAEAAKLFGGSERLAFALREPRTRKLFQAFLAKTGPGQLLSHDGRRFLSWATVAEKILDNESASETLPVLLASSAIERGLLLKCQRCRQKAWYHLAAVSESFTCNRCRLLQDVEPGWGPGNEPVWFYRLAEVLYQFLRSNGDLPLLAVHDEFGDHPIVAQSYELDLFPSDADKWEMDIFVSDGPQLWIGEATTTGRLDPGRLKTVAEFAKLVDPYGVLLATSKQRWASATMSEATSAFPSGSWPRLKMLTGVS
jgi:hypothetical protein